MLNWFADNWGTILVCVILAAVIVAIVIRLRKDKKAGKCTCGANCKSCGGNCHACKSSCHSS
ncbi:MAG: FeoB-associated Cys-rich membrane protein [Parasporobacterium sp.]|nr:FeoB-associated Cys-rich membrane protein [Parasporobacterium sp.]